MYKNERHPASTGGKGKKGHIDVNLLSGAAVIWMFIKLLPDDLGFLLGDRHSAAAVAFMLNPSVETPLIVGLAHRSPPLFIAFTSALFHDNLDSSGPQISPLDIIRE